MNAGKSSPPNFNVFDDSLREAMFVKDSHVFQFIQWGGRMMDKDVRCIVDIDRAIKNKCLRQNVDQQSPQK